MQAIETLQRSKGSLRAEHEHRTRRGVRIFKQPRICRGEVIGWSSNYILLVKWGGKQYSFSLKPERREAGKLADKISSYLKVEGHTPEMAFEAFLPNTAARRKQIKTLPVKSGTVGDIISQYEENYARARASSKRAYARSLRKISAFILGMASLAKTNRSTKNRREWREKVDGLSLERITAGKLQAFKSSLLRQADDDEARGRAKTTCNSYLRNASQFFSPRALKVYEGLSIPPNPFPDVEREEEPRHYFRSSVKMETVVINARKELRIDHPGAFTAFLLAAFGGLSKSEMDKLLWDQIDLEKRIVTIRTTPFYTPKRRAREQVIALPEIVVKDLIEWRKVQDDPNSPFVLPGGGGKARYRAKGILNTLSRWLRQQGFTGKTIHDLRKEAGSLIYRQTGSIDRAAQFLRNDPRTAREHYVDSTERLEVNYEQSSASRANN